MIEILAGKRILIAEDELLIATELEAMFDDAGAEVLGPVTSVSNGLDIIQNGGPIDAAILDINLSGEFCFPIADALRDAGSVFVICTGYEKEVLPPNLKDVPCLLKPIGAEELAHAISQLLIKNQSNQARSEN